MVDEMADMSGKGTDQCEDSGDQVKLKKLCMDCGTSKTPLWRGGPAGPKSLCNACGIRNRKKRSSLLELTKVDERKMKKIIINNNGSSCSSNNGNSDSSSKDRLMAMWDILRPQINMRIEELSEEQQAAILLMSLSHKFSYC